jgi:hypothetical protein
MDSNTNKMEECYLPLDVRAAVIAEFMVGGKIGNLRTIFFLVGKLLKSSKEEKWFLKCRIPQNERGVLG